MFECPETKKGIDPDNGRPGLSAFTTKGTTTATAAPPPPFLKEKRMTSSRFCAHCPLG